MNYQKLVDVVQNTKTAKDYANALYKQLCEESKLLGQDPKKEVFIMSPLEVVQKNMRGLGSGKYYLVCWESGPYEWAIIASMKLPLLPNGDPAEPYYSFDLCIYE